MTASFSQLMQPAGGGRWTFDNMLGGCTVVGDPAVTADHTHIRYDEPGNGTTDVDPNLGLQPLLLNGLGSVKVTSMSLGPEVYPVWCDVHLDAFDDGGYVYLNLFGGTHIRAGECTMSTSPGGDAYDAGDPSPAWFPFHPILPLWVAMRLADTTRTIELWTSDPWLAGDDTTDRLRSITMGRLGPTPTRMALGFSGTAAVITVEDWKWGALVAPGEAPPWPYHDPSLAAQHGPVGIQRHG